MDTSRLSCYHAFVCNVLLNAVFIFGMPGAPKMGVDGAALATNLSRLILLAGCFFVLFGQMGEEYHSE